MFIIHEDHYPNFWKRKKRSAIHGTIFKGKLTWNIVAVHFAHYQFHPTHRLTEGEHILRKYRTLNIQWGGATPICVEMPYVMFGEIFKVTWNTNFQREVSDSLLHTFEYNSWRQYLTWNRNRGGVKFRSFGIILIESSKFKIMQRGWKYDVFSYFLNTFREDDVRVINQNFPRRKR